MNGQETPTPEGSDSPTDSWTRFQLQIARVRVGDPAAAAELIREYEPEVRRLIRVRLTDPKLRVFADSADISQSVLRVFFVKVAAGQYDLGEPANLLRLLVTMIRNKVLDVARKPAVRRAQPVGPGTLEAVPGRGETPSQLMAGEELIAAARRLLTPDERDIADRRVGGASWQEIASTLGSTPDAARKKLDRALERVCRELGIERGSDE